MSSTKTIVGLEFSGIMSKDEVVRKAFLLTAGNNFGNMGRFNMKWFEFKKEYRNRFLYKNISRKMGSDARGFLDKYVINEAEENVFLTSSVPGYLSTVDSGVQFPDAMLLAEYYLQNKYGPDWSATYTIDSSVFNTKGTGSIITSDGVKHFTMEFSSASGSKTITEENNFQDSTYVVRYMSSASSGVQIKFMEIDDVTAFAKKSRVEVMPIIPIQVKGKRAKNDTVEKRTVEWYFNEFGLDKEELYKNLDKVDKGDKGKNIDNMYGIIAVQPVDPYVLPECSNTKKLKAEDVQNYPWKVLKHGGDRDSEFFNVPCGPDSVAGSKAWWMRKNRLQRRKFAALFYELITFYGNGISTLKFKTIKSTLDIKYSSKIKRGAFTLEDGSKASIGSVMLESVKAKKGSNSGPNKGGGTRPPKDYGKLIIHKQITAERHERITITKLTQMIKISGEQIKLHLDGSWKTSGDKKKSGKAGEKYPRIWIPMEIYDRLDFTTTIVIREHGTELMMFAKKKVKTSWFKIIIGIIFTIVVCVFGTVGCPSMVGALSGYLGVSIGIAAALYGVAIAAIGMLVQDLLSNIDNPYLRGLANVTVGVLMAFAGSGFDMSNIAPANFLPLASKVAVSMYSAYIETKMKDLQSAREAEAIRDNIEARFDAGEESDRRGRLAIDLSSHSSQVEANGADALYAQQENLYNFDQYWAASDQLTMRTNVVPG